MREAPHDGTPILGFWPDTNLWSDMAWMKPSDIHVEHWCRHMKWTPSVDPECWLPMPQSPRTPKIEESAT